MRRVKHQPSARPQPRDTVLVQTDGDAGGSPSSRDADLRELCEQQAQQLRILDATLTTIADFAYTFDRDGRFVYSNRPLLDLLGITFDEIVGKDFFDLGYPPDLATRLQHQIEHVFVTKENVVDETPFTGPSGSEGYYEYIFRPVFAVDGSIERVAGSTRDVTERRRVQEQSRHILMSIIDAFVALDADWRFTYANRQAERLLDRTPGDLIGHSIWDTYPGLADSAFERAYRRAADAREGSSFTEYYPDHRRWYEVRVYSAEPAGVTIYFRDVTEQHRLEKQKDDFLAIASHELKTPVSSIKAFAQVLARRFQKAGDSDSATLVGKMDSQLNKLTGLIGDLLDVTRIESGQIRFRPQAFAVDRLIREITDQIHLTAPERVLRIDGRADRSIVADRDRTGQVLMNLLTNAVKFAPAGSEIVVAVAADADGVAVTVTDSGIGISRERQTLVFDRFYRVSGPEPDTYPGLGLGLFISAEIVRRQGGRV